MASTQTEAPTLPDRAAARGWLVRPAPGDDERGDAESATSVLLDLSRPAHVVLTVRGPSGAWEHRLSPRHAEIGHARPAYRLARTQPVNK
jgi:hypothetical protein